jgi:hypothetical protein
MPRLAPIAAGCAWLSAPETPKARPAERPRAPAASPRSVPTRGISSPFCAQWGAWRPVAPNASGLGLGSECACDGMSACRVRDEQRIGANDWRIRLASGRVGWGRVGWGRSSEPSQRAATSVPCRIARLASNSPGSIAPPMSCTRAPAAFSRARPAPPPPAATAPSQRRPNRSGAGAAAPGAPTKRQSAGASARAARRGPPS